MNSGTLVSAMKVTAASALMLTLAACGDKSAPAEGEAAGTGEKAAEQSSTPEGQVVARVNGEEVTIHELNSELSRINIPQNADRKAIEENVLRALINRKVLEQKAMSDGLDRVPSVIADIRRSRSTILAQAYMRSQMTNAPVVSRQEAEAYILDNPQLFANRTYYIFDAVLAPSGQIPDAKKDEFEQLGDLNEIERRLTSDHIPNQRKPYTAFTETIPAAMMQKLPELVRDRTVFFVVQGDRTMITQFRESRPAVLTGEEANRAATRLLQTRKGREIAAKVQQDAVDAANVTFMGKYSDMAKNPPNLVNGNLQQEIDSTVQTPDTTQPANEDAAGGDAGSL